MAPRIPLSRSASGGRRAVCRRISSMALPLERLGDSGALSKASRLTAPRKASQGWKVVESKYNKYALANNKSERDIKSLQTKYNQILRKKKPTGRAACPPEIKRAHHIEGLIDQRANTRVLSDSDADIDDGGNLSSDDAVEVVPPASSAHTAVARHAPIRTSPRE
ncbi:hypothetical protein B0H14DRAFT_2641048 [Mycena olivaceomarginata]|nr:hypothetical protein B0H14DRAFT_2641048 [Mycena olivaceomarginata]